MPPEAEPLHTTARRALWWSVANNVVGRVGTTLMGIVLARLLVPEDYGIYAVALVALNALLSMNELGVSLAIVRRPGDVSRIAPTVKTLAFGSSLVLWLATFLAAPHVAAALDAPEATNVLRLLTLSVLIDALTAVPSALMTRDFMQKERLIVDTAGFLTGAVVAIALAVAGFGAWALVWSVLLGNIVNALFILRYSPDRHPYGFRRDVARELLAFGLPLALASLVIMALLNIDYVVIGAELGPVQLGFYLLAFNLCSWPVNMFSAPARRVSLPLFARLHAGETEASSAFVPVCTLLLLVTLPACLALAALAEPIVAIVYGDTWRPAAVRPPLADGARARAGDRRAGVRLPRRARILALEPHAAGRVAGRARRLAARGRARGGHRGRGDGPRGRGDARRAAGLRHRAAAGRRLPAGDGRAGLAAARRHRGRRRGRRGRRAARRRPARAARRRRGADRGSCTWRSSSRCGRC